MGLPAGTLVKVGFPAKARGRAIAAIFFAFVFLLRSRRWRAHFSVTEVVVFSPSSSKKRFTCPTCHSGGRSIPNPNSQLQPPPSRLSRATSASGGETAVFALLFCHSVQEPSTQMLGCILEPVGKTPTRAK